MVFYITLLIPVIFVILNFVNLVISKDRIQTTAIIIITHLALILFFSLTIVNQNLSKEIALTLIIYLIAILFITGNYDFERIKAHNILSNKSKKTVIISTTIIAILAFILLSYLSFASYNIINNQQNIISPTNKDIAVNGQRNNLIQNKLDENSLIKSSSNLILIITALGTIILLNSKRK